jgi:hypothetical protein
MQTQNQRQQVGLSQDKIDLVHKQFDGLMGMVTSLAQDPRIGTAQGPELVQQTISRAVKMGMAPQDLVDQAMQTLPQNPADIPQWVRTQASTMLDNKQRFDAVYGVPGTLDNGSSVQPVAVSPITGVHPIAAPFQKTLSPESRAQPISGTNAQGQPTITPLGGVLAQGGYNAMTAQPQTAPNGPANQMQPYGAGNPAPQPAGQPTAAPSGSVVMGPVPGVVEGAQASAKASADKYSNDAAAQTNYQQNMMPIQQAFEHVKALGPTGMGPGSEEFNQMKSFLVTMGVMNPDQKLSDTDQANKYLSAMMRTSGFTGSDAQLDAAGKANPTMKTSQGAAMAVIQKAAAMARMQNAQVQAFQTSGQGTETYSKWAAGWNAKQNAAAYAFDMMEPAQRLAYAKSLKGDDLAKFRSSLATAVGLGLVTPPANGN